MPKRILIFLSPIQRGLSVTYLAPENEDVNWCALAQTVETFPNFCAGVLQVPKTTKNGYFRGVFVIGYSSNGRISDNANHFGEYIVDIPRMCLSWVSFGGGRTVCALYGE